MPARLSYLITWRDGRTPTEDDSRRRNLHTVLTWLARDVPEAEVIVVEQDEAPRLTGPLPHPSAQVLFAYNPGPFNKSWGFNVAQRRATTNVLAFGDADLVVPARLVRQATDLCSTTHVAANPYRRLIDLTPAETRFVAQGHFDGHPARAEASQNREAIGEKLPFCGGLFLIRREGFVHLGGWDERFRGWGGEDDAMTYKILRSGMPATELDGAPALHLWHPRPRELTYDQPHYAANTALLADYYGADDEQLFRLGEVMFQSGAFLEKYRHLAR